MPQILDKGLPFTPLQAQDRCDRCGAQAFVRVATTGGFYSKALELLFCGHHFARHELALMPSGFAVVNDDRASINTRPMSGQAMDR